MSKKDRLRKEKEKQLAKQRAMEQAEKVYKENFEGSKSVEKYKKKKGKTAEPAYYLIIKLLMLIPYGWSGFFWGGVLCIAILIDIVNIYDFSTVSEKTAAIIIAGVIVMAVALVLEFFRKYIFGFVASAVGVGLYITGVNQYIKPITQYLETKAVEESLLGMDKTWMYRCYPIWAFLALSGILLAISVITRIVKAKKEKNIRDNAPVKSIVSD